MSGVPASLPVDQLRELCSAHRVRTLWLFGSAATGEFDPARSDYDFAVEFLPGPRSGLDDVYFRLHEALESLLGRRVDLVEYAAIRNPYVLRSVDRTKVPVYAAA